MTTPFELCLFHVDPFFVQAAVKAGVDTIIIDWENKRKEQRQKWFDTQINYHTVEDLSAIRKVTQANIICRINAIGAHIEKEIDDAVLHGADELLIPMVRSVKEVENVLGYVKGKIKVGILIETNQAVACSKQLAELPLCRIYVGLNDLSIENQNKNIFTPIATGVLDHIRNLISLPFGFGGITLPDRGHPIPARLLIGELMRLKCHFSFLRRSFLADVRGKNLSFEVNRIKEALDISSKRTPEEITSDYRELIENYF